MIIARDFIYILACISFVTVIGGATYEHLAVVPKWASAVPASLAMFQGEYGLAPQRFWIPIHPVTLGLLLASLVMNWKTDRRVHLLTALCGYAIILALTFVYFVPELMALTGSAYSASVDAELTRRSGIWESLSLVRLAVLYILAIVLMWGLAKSTWKMNR